MTTTLSNLPPIETARLRLACLGLDDAAALQQLTDDPAITGVIHFLRSPFTLSDAQALIRQAGDGRDQFVGAWRRDDARLIGTVGAHLRGADDIEIGYWIGSAVHGKGFGSEAVHAVIMVLRQEFPDRRIIAECRRDNIASWKLLERLTFRSTGESGMRPGRQLLVLGA